MSVLAAITPLPLDESVMVNTLGRWPTVRARLGPQCERMKL